MHKRVTLIGQFSIYLGADLLVQSNAQAAFQLEQAYIEQGRLLCWGKTLLTISTVRLQTIFDLTLL